MNRIEAHTVRPGMVLDSAGGFRVSKVKTTWAHLREWNTTFITGRVQNGQGEERTVQKHNHDRVQVKESR